MLNIFDTPYQERPETRLESQLRKIRRQATTTKKQRLTFQQKLEYDQMNPSDRLRFLRNIEKPEL